MPREKLCLLAYKMGQKLWLFDDEIIFHFVFFIFEPIFIGGWSVCHGGRARRLVACSDPKNEFACASLIKPESSKRC